MTDMVDNEQQTEDAEVVELFSENFDDKALLESNEDAIDSGEGESADESGTDDDLPEKYKGKSIRDIIDMHQNLEKAYGRHNNELGELRQLTDQILKQQLESNTAPRKALEIDSDALLENPAETLNKVIETNPTLTALQQRLEARERAEQEQAFKRIHPDSDKVVNDPRFAAWVQASPTRLALFQKAHQSYDYELAAELLTLYKSVEGITTEEGRAVEAKRQMKSPSKNAGAGAQGAKKQVFRRADLMRLKAEDPDRYERLQPQILQAYAEGRVK